MEIKINAVGFSASSQLEDFIQKKISKLDKGQEVFAKKNAKKFEEAVDELYDVVKRQLVKIKEKEREC